MVNDTTTLNGALSELGETLASNITSKGVSASASDGLTTLANKVLQITGGGGSTTLFEDDCSSASGLTNYGSSVLIRGTNASATISYDSTNNCYALTGTGNYHAMIPIPALNDKDSYTIEADFKGQSVAFNSVGFFLDNRNDTTSYGLGVFMQVYDRKFISRQYKVSADGTQTTESNLTFNANNWYHMEMTVNGSSLTGNLYNGDTLMGTVTQTLTVNNKQMGLFLFCEGGATTSTCYVKNIKAESLGGDTPCSEYTTQINNAITYINGSGS